MLICTKQKRNHRYFVYFSWSPPNRSIALLVLDTSPIRDPGIEKLKATMAHAVMRFFPLHRTPNRDRVNVFLTCRRTAVRFLHHESMESPSIPLRHTSAPSMSPVLQCCCSKQVSTLPGMWPSKLSLTGSIPAQCCCLYPQTCFLF